MFTRNNNIEFISHSDIVEWDMKKGNLSMIKEYSLLPTINVNKLESLDKEKRNVLVGIMQREDKEFAKNLEKCFNKTITKFIEVNKIPEDNIISIKRDAVFIKNWEIHKPQLSDNIIFVEKNQYKHYVFINPFEIYIKNAETIDVKGMKDEFIPLHINGILKFLYDMCEEIDVNKQIAYIREYMKLYSRLDLPADNYREFSNNPVFTCMQDMHIIKLDEIDDSIMDGRDSVKLITQYNYYHIIKPFLEIFLANCKKK